MVFPTLHVEVIQKEHSSANNDFIKYLAISYIRNFVSFITPGLSLRGDSFEEVVEYQEHIQAITFCDIDHEGELSMTDVELVYHIYKFNNSGPETNMMMDANPGENMPAAEVWALPAPQFHGLWESLVYDSNLKVKMVRFVEAALALSESGADPNVVACSRVALLHGPPGTGKTALCRALAHKMALRLGDRFSHARLVEIKAHCVFSKWFAESGRLVERLFEQLRALVEDRRMLACVLIDEVESVAHARRSSLAGLEPSDSIRAVNALLTQLDRLRRHPNVLVLTTSNLSSAIDLAFVDRADIKCHVGAPTARAAYAILLGCCVEVMRCGVVAPRESLYSLRSLESSRFEMTSASLTSLRLWAVASDAVAAALSGRSLRRLPLLALAHLPLQPQTQPRPTLSLFLNALQGALAEYAADLAQMDT